MLPALASMYRAEAALGLGGAFMTHGVGTFVVLFGGWVCCCAAIDWVAANSAAVRASKLQPEEKTDDPKLRALARRVVTRNWFLVLGQTLLFAPLLKAAFPLQAHLAEPAMSPLEVLAFFLIWFVSNDFLFTCAHTAFHEIPWLYKVAHKEHHTWKAPFAWMSHAMSAYELTANGIGVMFWPVAHALWLGRTTPLELVWFVQLVSQLIGCVEHSGFDALNPLVVVDPAYFPSWLFSTTRHHDDHHKHFKGNYGGYLAIWDTLMGTTIPPGASSYVVKKMDKNVPTAVKATKAA